MEQNSKVPQQYSNLSLSSPSWHVLLLPYTLMCVGWAVLGISFLTQWHMLIDHDYLLVTSHLPWFTALMIFLGGWQIMILAMMLPASLSQLLRFQGAGKVYWRDQCIFIVGYATVWTGFALFAFVGDTLLHQLVHQWWWLYLHTQLIGTATLAVAGIFQWSPLKRSCLEYCAVSQPSQIPRTLQKVPTLFWQQGIRYGMWCLGSDWALMLVMFGIGMKSFFVMALLACVMLLEHELCKRAWLQSVLGGVCVLAALLWYLSPFIF